MEKYMIEIDNVTKRYILGQIGGTTLHEELQRRRAKRLGKEDPTKKIGAKNYADGEEFWALSGVSFKVKKGERVGIIGHNGAGKSTLLKLLSRVTAPTTGEIGLDGRVTSMLEVGTGFNGELTGRENIYMNGAILGMTKKEIDAKMDDIIEFSECGQFIDTPVKRYSSGMYVKLAFSVAAHLDSEIMIMDEVLAVGDMAFQKKCLDKMNDVSRSEGRTILYVSHNMNTIRQLCERVVVLDHGKVVFDGGVEEGIGIYLGTKGIIANHYEYSEEYHENLKSKGDFYIKALDVLEKDDMIYLYGSKAKWRLKLESKQEFSNVGLRFEMKTYDGVNVGTMFLNKKLNFKKDEEKVVSYELDLSHIAPGKYTINIVAYIYDRFGNEQFIDGVYPGCIFAISDEVTDKNELVWLSQYWGNIRLNDVVEI